MASVEPVVVLFGSVESLSKINARFPVTVRFVANEDSLEDLITEDIPLFVRCLPRYFLILLNPIRNELFNILHAHHRVQVIYGQKPLNISPKGRALCRSIHQCSQQFTLDITNDIVDFLTREAEKQVKLERVDVGQIYCRQGTIMKEWAMSYAKAAPCHILLVPLNTTEANLQDAQQRLQKVCNKMGYPSTIVRLLREYIPTADDKLPHLLPYANTLFNYENPFHICKLLQNLCPIRLYLYGNGKAISSEWSQILISQETEVMSDEDNWCAFVENEAIEDEIRWNFGVIFGSKWHLKRLCPLSLSSIDKSFRFQSAVQRAQKTVGLRQFQVTAQIFRWHDECVRNGDFKLQPSFSVPNHGKKHIMPPYQSSLNNYSVDESLLVSKQSSIISKGISFVWLDAMVFVVPDDVAKLANPSQWNCFQTIAECISFIEKELRKENEIFLVVSGALAYELFVICYSLMSLVEHVYIHCSEINIHNSWVKYYTQIRGIYNDTDSLVNDMRSAIEEARQSQVQRLSNTATIPNTTAPHEVYNSRINVSPDTIIPILVYDEENPADFLAHQRSIDIVICMRETDEARSVMLNECRRVYESNPVMLQDIDDFAKSYHENSALYWYTRDSFIFRVINQSLRSSDANLILKFGYFLADLHNQLKRFSSTLSNHKVYRGQLIPLSEFENFRQLTNRIISIKTFFSTTTSLQVALQFAGSNNDDPEMIPVIFCITLCNSGMKTRPFADISNFSAYLDEEEVLLSMGSSFRVQSIDRIDQYDNIPVICLEMIDLDTIMRPTYP